MPTTADDDVFEMKFSTAVEGMAPCR